MFLRNELFIWTAKLNEDKLSETLVCQMLNVFRRKTPNVAHVFCSFSALPKKSRDLCNLLFFAIIPWIPWAKCKKWEEIKQINSWPLDILVLFIFQKLDDLPWLFWSFGFILSRLLSHPLLRNLPWIIDLEIKEIYSLL